MRFYPASLFLSGNTENALLRLLLDQVNLEHLADWLVPELSVYWIFALLALPVFCVILTADQTASDKARGTLRFLHLRATREAIYFGRFLGQMLVQLLFVLITLGTAFTLAVYRDPSVADQRIGDSGGDSNKHIDRRIALYRTNGGCLNFG